MNKKILFLMLGMILLIGIGNVSAVYVYQENANLTVGGPGGWNPSYTALFDGNWGTGAIASVYDAYQHAIYTKPQYAVGALWQVKDSGGTFNLTVPQSNFSYNSTSLNFQLVSVVGAPAGNNGWWIFEANIGGTQTRLRSSSSNTLYEEGIWWDMLYAPSVTLNSPTNYINTTISNINFNTTISDLNVGYTTIVNVSLYIDNVLNETNTSGKVGEYDFTKILSEGNHNWSIISYNNLSMSNIQETRLITIDKTNPTISVLSPTPILNYNNNNLLNLTFTATDINLDKCWYNYNFTNTTIGCFTGVSNTTNINLTSQRNITIYSNDTVGNINYNYITFNYKVFENSRTVSSTSYETATETYLVNVIANNSLTGINLLYNGTSFPMSNLGSGIWSYSKTLSNIGNNSIQFNFIYAGQTISSDITYQNVLPIQFGLCNATLTVPFINYTFKDEATNGWINASIPSSTFVYYLGDGSITKTLTYINTGNQTNYTFCALPGNQTYKIDSYVQYKFGTDYPQRIYDPDVASYTNSTTNITLYLLSSTDGIYVTFQVINVADQTISGVEVTATRTINGNSVTVASGTTGSDGTVTFWLNPDFSHDFVFTKSGYTTYETSLIPTQSSYTITLSGGGGTVPISYGKGIVREIFPKNTSLANDTIYTFGINLTSSYWDISEYGFNLRLLNGTIISGGSTSTQGTLITLNYNTTNQTRIFLDYYWVINGVYTNGTIDWKVYNTLNTQWSIKTFFVDLKLYLYSGLFGIDNFGRYLLIFLALFFSIGILGYKYGLNNPLFVTGMIFFVIFFLDIAVGIIPPIIVMNGNEVKHLLTFVSGLIFVISILWEANR